MLKSTVIVFAAAALTGSGPCNTPTDTAPDKLIGMWGGENAVAYVEDTVVHVHIGCTVGNSNQLIVPEPGGQFDIKGEYNITAYPVYRPPDHPARFSGTIRGATMTLTIALTDTAVTLGPVTLYYGREPHMGPCPICRRPVVRRP